MATGEPRSGGAPEGAGMAARLPAALLDRLRRRVAVGAGERAELDVAIPFTGGTLGRVPHCTPDDVRDAIARPRRAQPAWAALSAARRARVRRRVGGLVRARREVVLDLVQLESGKARFHALEEVLDVALVARHYAATAPRLLRPRRHRGAVPFATSVREIRRPHGVVGIIAPWNFPLVLGITDALAALVAGNAVVLRPDVQSSYTALWAAELLREAGLDAGLLPVVTGPGAELGPALVDGVDHVVFTGSTRTGRTVATRAAGRLVGASLELGGKNAMLVLADADVDAAAEGAVRGAFVGAGQVCVSIERIYVHESLHDRFVARLVDRLSRLRLGAALDYSREMGSLTTPGQLERVERQVADAVSRGARVLAGGRRRPDLGPLFHEPTVLAGVTPEMEVHDEETFGPVVSVYPVSSDDEAVTRANASRYGLNASVWSRSAGHARRVAERLEAGTVNVNEAYAATWGSTAAPVGGVKESGLGRRHGDEGLLKYTTSRVIARQRLHPIAPPRALSPEATERLATLLVRVVSRLRWPG